MDRSVRAIVRRDPGSFADAIAPAIGPAIRKTVADALRAMLQRLDAALERSLTLESLRWRVEARRTGRAFAEVALLRTLVYRVEQVFLIHRGSGLLLQHVLNEGVFAEDPDQVSAMLSAIESFAHEAFQEDARLERFRVGELGGWVAHGPSALLVAIVRGTAPEEFERQLRATLDHVHVEHGDALAGFRGDPAPFARARALLLDCVRERSREPRRRWAAPALLLAVFSVVLGLAVIPAWRAHRRLSAYADVLRREPGVVVTAAELAGDRYAVAGLRDPLSVDPAAALSRHGLDPARAALRFEPFYSLDPRIVARRAEAILSPPAGVSLTFRGATLTASGAAPAAWIESARQKASALPGVASYADQHLHAEEKIARARTIAAALDRDELRFASGSKCPAEEHAHLERDEALAGELFTLAHQAGMTVRVEVLGYADPTGAEEENRAIALGRADCVAAALRAHGGAADQVEARGAGVRGEALGRDCAKQADRTGCGAADQRARSAVIRVTLGPAEDM